MNRFFSHAPMACPRKTAHSAVATTKQVGQFISVAPGGSVNRPSERTSPKKRKHRDDFHLFGANSLNNRLWGTPVKGYFLLSLNGDRHVVLRAIIQVSFDLVVAR